MITEQEEQSTVASRLRMHIDNIYTLTGQLTDSQLEALDYSVADVWSAFGFQMVSCSKCRETIPEVLTTEQQGRSYCPECIGKQTGYSTTGSRRRRSTIRYRRPR